MPSNNYPGLQFQTVNVALARGLSQRDDDRARPSTALDLARDLQFDEDGGVQTRLPYLGIGSATLPDSSIFGGGVLADVRRLAVNGDELVLFTKDKLYSWNATLSKWVLRGTHLAVTVDETPRFATTGDQIDGDRAELSGTVVFAWTEGAQVYAAALDKATGSVLVSPTAVSTAIGRPRLVALATKILLFVEASTTLLTVRAIDPAAPGTAISGAGTTVLATNFNLYYDVVKAGTQDLVVGACRRVTTTSYTVFTVTPALVVTTSTKARTADGPLAVATIADGTQTQIVRANAFNIQGDLLTTSTLADVFTAQAIGSIPAVTSVNNVTAAFVGTTCTAFYSGNEATGFAAFELRKNTVTTANSVGTQALLVESLGLASRAFVDDSNVYVWAAFGSDSGVGNTAPAAVRAQLQNTYYLYRSDGLLVTKATWDVGGGLTPSIGHLPGVAATSGTYSWLGAFRRLVSIGSTDQTNLGARTPIDISITFDDQAARRTAVIGRTMYIAGGIVQQYDGRQIAEVGFSVYPWAFAATDNGAGGNLSAGTYTWKATMRWINACGEVERSTTATGTQLTLAASHSADLQPVYLFVTKKTSPVPTLELWRNQVNATEEAPYYLCSGIDPNTTTGNNPYIPNDSGSTYSTHLIDNFSDATLALKESNPENGAVLESLAPPGATIIIATDTRVFLGDVTGDPDRVWYSRLRGSNDIASFHDTLTFNVPRPGGRMTALFIDNEILYVARETAIYAFGGVGKDNLGQGQNFQLLHTVSTDVGVISQEAHALTPAGTLLKSSKGWHLLRGGSVEYIGAAVTDFDTDEVLRIDTIQTRHHVRILTDHRLILWAYPRADFPGTGQFGEWTVATTNGALHDSAIYRGAHVLLVDRGSSVQGIMTQASTYASLNYGIDVETAWIKPGDVLQGANHVRKIQPLGEVRSACLVRARIAYNYQQDANGNAVYVDDKVYDASAITAGSPLQFAISPKRPKCDAFKLRLTAVLSPAANNFPATLSTALMATPVATTGTVWDAGWLALATEWFGALGNAVTLSIAFDAAAADEAFSIDRRAHFRWDQTSQIWSPSVNNAGLRVVMRAGSRPTVAQLETAIQLFTVDGDLLELDTGDAFNAAESIAVSMIGLQVTGAFAGGGFSTPTGEAIKLTSLGIEVGVEPGLFRRLSAAQRI